MAEKKDENRGEIESANSASASPENKIKPSSTSSRVFGFLLLVFVIVGGGLAANGQLIPLLDSIKTTVESFAIAFFASIAKVAKSNCTAFCPCGVAAVSPIVRSALAFAPATISMALASPSALNICCVLSASAASTFSFLSGKSFTYEKLEKILLDSSIIISHVFLDKFYMCSDGFHLKLSDPSCNVCQKTIKNIKFRSCIKI